MSHRCAVKHLATGYEVRCLRCGEIYYVDDVEDAFDVLTKHQRKKKERV